MSARDGTIHREELAERLRHFNMSTYLATSDLLSAGVIALGAGVGLEIAVAPDLLKAGLWVTSLMLFVAFHALWRLGALFVSWSSGMVDYMAPLLLGLFEFAQFIVLSSQFHSPHWSYAWLGATVGQVAMGAVFVHNRLAHLKAPGQYAPDTATFMETYRTFMVQGRLGAAVWSLILAGLTAAGLLLGPAWAGRAVWIGAALSLLLAIVSLRASVMFQHRFEALLFEGDTQASSRSSA